MAELTKELFTLDRKVYQISGPLGVEYPIKAGEGEIVKGQVLSIDTSTGEVKKYTTSDEAFSIALVDVDESKGDTMVTVAMPVTEYAKQQIVGINPDTDFKAVYELLKNGGIILRGVDD